MISNLLILDDGFSYRLHHSYPWKTAIYKQATLQYLEALIVIPNSVVIFVYPYFAEHNMDNGW